MQSSPTYPRNQLEGCQMSIEGLMQIEVRSKIKKSFEVGKEERRTDGWQWVVMMTLMPWC